jgi:hypothetical protein
MKGCRGNDQVKGSGNRLESLERFFSNRHRGKPREIPSGEARQLSTWLQANDFAACWHKIARQLTCAAANL